MPATESWIKELMDTDTSDAIPLPMLVRIAAMIVVLLFITYLSACIWYILDFSQGWLYVLGGLLKIALIPIPMLLLEYAAIIRRHPPSVNIAAFGWLAMAAAFTVIAVGGLVVPEAGVIFSLAYAPLIAVTAFVAFAHLRWRSLLLQTRDSNESAGITSICP